MQLAARIASSGGYGVYLLRGCDEDQRYAYYFVLVHRSKIRRFKEAIADESEALDITAYGKILASGYGFSPPASLLQEMQATYGGNH